MKKKVTKITPNLNTRSGVVASGINIHKKKKKNQIYVQQDTTGMEDANMKEYPYE